MILCLEIYKTSKNRLLVETTSMVILLLTLEQVNAGWLKFRAIINTTIKKNVVKVKTTTGKQKYDGSEGSHFLQNIYFCQL